MRLKIDKARFDAMVNKGIAHLALLLFFIFAGYEMQIFVRTWMALKDHSERIPVVEWQQNIASDVKAFANCKESNFTSAVDNEVNWAARAECVATQSSNVKTSLGYRLSASILSSAIRHKEVDHDKYLQLAQEMVKLARDQLVFEELEINKSFARANDLMNYSMSYRLRGIDNNINLFEKTADQLDQLEMSLYKPDLLIEQENWRIKVRGQTDCKFADGKCVPITRNVQQNVAASN
jgi:hypothetical protein